MSFSSTSMSTCKAGPTANTCVKKNPTEQLLLIKGVWGAAHALAVDGTGPYWGECILAASGTGGPDAEPGAHPIEAAKEGRR
eukprot:1065640-Prorocentrum_minimum.AAC.1